jgi:DNA-binding transcriptional ArsR family regulator
MKNDLQGLAELDRTIHEPARLMIVSLLYLVREADFLYLLRETGLSKGNLSSHLTRLEQAGYLKISKTYRGKIPLTLCSLTPAGRAAFQLYRRRLRAAIGADRQG